MEISLLFANTFLLRVPWPGPLARLGHLYSAPAVQARASEYGAVLSEYDVAALCEVFRADDLDRIVDGWGAPRRPDTAVGPRARSAGLADSGLATLSAGSRIVRSRTRVFAEQGSKLRDADAWAAKGVLVAEIELPPPLPNLEVVSSHLIAGGDVGDTARHRRATDRVRGAQVAELLDEAGSAHRPGNVTLIVGDLNVPAGTAAGDRLVETMSEAGYRDLWLDHGTGPGWTCDPIAVGAPITALDPDDGRFCADPAPHHDQAERIDYAFLADSGLTPSPVEVRSIRRRVFPRAAGRPDVEEMPLLSDHVALHLELTIHE